jgi:hypothetical protein
LAHDDSSLWFAGKASEKVAVSATNLEEANGWRWPSSDAAGSAATLGPDVDRFGTERGFDSEIEIAIQRLHFP